MKRVDWRAFSRAVAWGIAFGLTMGLIAVQAGESFTR